MKGCIKKQINGGKKRRRIKGCKRRYVRSSGVGWEALGFAVLQNAFEEYIENLYKEDTLKEKIAKVKRENDEIEDMIDYYDSCGLNMFSEAYEALQHEHRTDLLRTLSGLQTDWELEQYDMKSLLNFMYYDKLGVGLLQFFNIDPDKIFVKIEDRYCQQMA